MTFSKYVLPVCISGAAFFALAASSPQCARTQDSPTSPNVGTLAEGNPCVQSCIDGFQAAMKDEQVRFKLAIQACEGDSVCQANEEAIHETTSGQIQADKAACFTNCGHEQGAGTSGQ